MDSMFDQLVELPLFRGVTRETMAAVVGRTKFHFLKYPAGETIIKAGDPCTHIKFILSGSVRLSIINSDGRFGVSQTLDGPDVISPDFLFGRATDYPCDVTALTTTSLVQITKDDYINILKSDSIFLFNFLNTLSMNAQKGVEGILALTNGSIEERIAFWVIALTQPGGKDIKLSCKRRDLYTLFGVPRQSFNAALEHMRERGLIEYTTNEISIVDRKMLLGLLHDNSESPMRVMPVASHADITD